MHIQWGPFYEVHIKIIDEQHKETVRLFNLLDDTAQALIAGAIHQSAVAPVIDALMKHLTFHIGTEEHYFDEFQYEHSDQHKKAHRAFMSGLHNILREYEDKPDKLCQNMIPVMVEWLTVHTAQHDKLYVDCFKQHGLV